MKDLRKNFLLTVFLIFAGCVNVAVAQKYNLSQRLDFKYSKNGDNEALYHIFSLLASNNSQNIYSIRVGVSFNLNYTFSEQKSHYKIEYDFYNKKASGDIRFRDFIIDTLLIPDSVSSVIKLKSGDKYETYRQNILFDKGTLILQKSKNIFNTPLPYLTVVKPLFSSKNSERFLNTAELINNYYGYSLLYYKILKHFGKLNLKSDNTPSEVFMALLALNRLDNYTRKHNFEGRLHLKQYDRENLLKKREKAVRMLRREKTLMKQKLAVSPTKKDCEDFVNSYIELSEIAIAEAKKLQPYRAASFKEFASEFQNENTLAILKTIEKYYNSSSGCNNVIQLIFNAFVTKAAVMSEQKSYVYGLIMLENAAYLYKNFKKVKRTGEFINTYAKLYDGLLSSYASVAVSALKSGNVKMFNEYYGKADKLFKKHLNDTAFSRLKIVFPRFKNRLVELAELNGDSVGFINNALIANAGVKDSVINSLFVKYCFTKLNNDIDRIKALLENKKLFAAKRYVDKTNMFIKRYADLAEFRSGSDSIFKTVAYSVYIELLQEGEIAYDKGDIFKAMDYLSYAYEMEKAYFDFRSEDLQNLLKKCFTPVAMEYINNASLKIWANKIDDALAIISDVKELQKKYKQTDNMEINSEIDKLQKKINVRICRSFQQEIDNICSKIASQVNRGDLDEAQKNYEKLMIMQNAESRCKIKRDNIRRTVTQYNSLFEFNRDFKALKQKIFKLGFSKSIDDYVVLEQRFNAENLSRFNTGFVNLYQFVKSQNSRIITSRTVEYFLGNGNYKEAFRYLELLRKMNVNPDVTRVYQRKLAKLYRQNNIKPDGKVFSDPWYSIFKNYYNGIVKEKLNPVKFIKD